MDCHPFFVFGKRRVGLLEMEELPRFVASQSILIGKLKRAPPPKGSQTISAWECSMRLRLVVQNHVQQ
jgi:hypothetical protein